MEMPRNVRNFWIEGHIDGRDSEVSGGPRNKDGGFRLAIFQRDDGSVRKALTIAGQTGTDGQLHLFVEDATNGQKWQITTKR
jgi:hypothetical protein